MEGGKVMKKTLKRCLIVSAFSVLCVIFSALSCSVAPTPAGYTLTVHNNVGSGITIWVRISSLPAAYIDHGPYDNGAAPVAFEVFPGYVIEVWNSSQGEWLSFSSGGNTFTITVNTVFYVYAGCPPYVGVSVFAEDAR